MAPAGRRGLAAGTWPAGSTEGEDDELRLVCLLHGWSFLLGYARAFSTACARRSGLNGLTTKSLAPDLIASSTLLS
jgi:hypothetical protein